MAEQRIRSPFPGMDPYLEDPARWPNFHATFIPSLRDALADAVAPKYIVGIEERVYVAFEGETEVPKDWIRPGVSVSSGPPPMRASAPAGTVVVVDDEEAPFIVPDFSCEEHRQRFLVIKVRETHEVVTVIELLSPANKRVGSRGRDEYLSKREDVLRSRASLVEL